MDPRSDEAFNALVTELTALKHELGEWRKNLPSYYESIPIPIVNSNDPTEQFDCMEIYPYTERLDYMTSACILCVWNLIRKVSSDIL